MGNIFRYSTKGESIVPLRDEITIIKSYIRIQKNRFQGKIEVFYFLPGETLQIPVMKMLLQPVVENAIFHGLEPKDGKGNLYLGARIEKGTLIITVKDDGVGIDPQTLRELEEALENGTNAGRTYWNYKYTFQNSASVWEPIWNQDRKQGRGWYNGYHFRSGGGK